MAGIVPVVKWDALRPTEKQSWRPWTIPQLARIARRSASERSTCGAHPHASTAYWPDGSARHHRAVLRRFPVTVAIVLMAGSCRFWRVAGWCRGRIRSVHGR